MFKTQKSKYYLVQPMNLKIKLLLKKKKTTDVKRWMQDEKEQRRDEVVVCDAKARGESEERKQGIRVFTLVKLKDSVKQ